MSRNNVELYWKQTQVHKQEWKVYLPHGYNRLLVGVQHIKEK